MPLQSDPDASVEIYGPKIKLSNYTTLFMASYFFQYTYITPHTSPWFIIFFCTHSSANTAAIGKNTKLYRLKSTRQAHLSQKTVVDTWIIELILQIDTALYGVMIAAKPI